MHGYPNPHKNYIITSCSFIFLDRYAALYAMITAAKWVPRGVAAETPKHAEFDEKELERINDLAKLELQEAEDDLKKYTDSSANPPIPAGEDSDLKEFHMEDYDKELEDERNTTISGVKSLAYYENPEEDEYLQKETEEERGEEQEDLKIKSTDTLLLAAKTEDDISMIEVYVYEETGDNMYVHHDFMLPSFPLCLEWLPLAPKSSSTGNYVAIGTFEPEIEIWDLDLVDSMFPTTILGTFDRPDAKAKGTGKKKRKLKQANSSYHVDAILALSSNRIQQNLLASGSADCTIKLWDLAGASNEKAALSLEKYHTSKVSSLMWNPVESSVLLSGGYDQRAIVGDVRSSNVNSDKRCFATQSDVENVQWDRDGTHFYASTELGQIFKFDARQESKPVWMLQAHDSEVSSFSLNEYVPGLMVTGSSDRQVKLWNVSTDRPSMVLSRDFDVGKVFTVSFAPDPQTRSVVSIGGSEGSLKVWDAFSNKAVRQAFNVSPGEIHDDHVLAANEDDSEESDREVADEELA